MLCGATRSPHRENYSVLKLCRRASAKSLGYRLSGERDDFFLEKKVNFNVHVASTRLQRSLAARKKKAFCWNKTLVECLRKFEGFSVQPSLLAVPVCDSSSRKAFVLAFRSSDARTSDLASLNLQRTLERPSPCQDKHGLSSTNTPAPRVRMSLPPAFRDAEPVFVRDTLVREVVDSV